MLGSLKCLQEDFKVMLAAKQRPRTLIKKLVDISIKFDSFDPLFRLLCHHQTVQERLTKQIAKAITDAINPAGVGVVVEAT